MTRSSFFVEFNRYLSVSDKSLGWYINSWEFPSKSDDWKICRLYSNKYRKKATKHLVKANKILNG